MPQAYPRLLEHAGGIVVHSPIALGTRVVLAVLGLVPLLAPYELLLRVRWTTTAIPAFPIAAAISLGAVALSVAAFTAALAGRGSELRFDARSATVRHRTGAPLLRRSERVVDLASIDRIEVVTTEWSDGDPSHVLRVVLGDGSHLDSGSSTSRDHVERVRERVKRFVRTTASR